MKINKWFFFNQTVLNFVKLYENESNNLSNQALLLKKKSSEKICKSWIKLATKCYFKNKRLICKHMEQ